MMDDLTELIKRMLHYSRAYENIGYTMPLFRLTPYEHKIFLNHLQQSILFFPKYYGDLPTYMGVNFELVGKPILFNGAHIRSDSGVGFEVEKMNETA